MTKPDKPAAKPEQQAEKPKEKTAVEKQVEYGGPKGAEPTRFGDWEKNGRCIDF
jgi:hypothetical protein